MDNMSDIAKKYITLLENHKEELDLFDYFEELELLWSKLTVEEKEFMIKKFKS